MKVIIITGQTATGKTAYALKLAQKYNGELINCDSRQIYKGLDIVTGKDIEKKSRFITIDSNDRFNIGYYLIRGVKLWLYDIVDLRQHFSSYDWVQCALFVIKNILSRNKTPIIVGGTYFYLYHLIYDVETQHIRADWKLRQELDAKPVRELQKLYRSLDKSSFNKLNNSDKNNPQRLIRKIEIISHYKKLKLPYQKHMTNFNIPKTISLGKKLDRKIQIQYEGLMYKNQKYIAEHIKKRVVKRLTLGAIEEVKNLLKNDYSEHDPGLKTIGCSQIISFLKKKVTEKQAIDEWITKEIQYAKRQFTFMSRDANICWKSIHI
jgi:tRNA dimethylallyltransferase